ncbi:MAG TPA: ATP-binding cassette domain-containing protein [Rhodocyclaceae bacterium]|nr:ATP-binding cassette domain-containing protein [Rhodocyclaceae bacterium]HNA02858.1 ATP-binding cassette domain-containing protein [Rhodocyclaceae bacterium]HNB77934.1 ATP-binding cassette domain-containing protein [Rhodocyclaceae bacterium]HNC60117.1 ATP-binding cassette domain-containing protein [Rhodocyclaceae bacterium]HNH12896.1 ATP-binding cassette domain-containing protein [Rhodocyclaceae bacterium]
MIRFEQVAKRYPGGHDALAGVSLAIARGEFAILVGHSGAGKSTLIRMVPVLERPSAGRVTVNDVDVGTLKRAAIPYFRRTLGLVLQEQSLLVDRNAFDNVMLPLAIAGHPARDAAKRVHAALERVGLAGRGKEMPPGLSGGEQQRLCIARAIVNKPSILIADEPTAFLDIDYARDIAELFRSFNEVGVTVIIATHDTGVFAAYQPRRIELAGGKLVQ